MLKRWLRGVVVLALAATGVLGVAAPAQAIDDLHWNSFHYGCTEVAGERVVGFIIWPPENETGVVTGLSINVPWQEDYGSTFTSVGSIFGKETLADGSTRVRNATGRFVVGPGPTSVTVSLSVHWDNFGGTGPLDLTSTRTLSLGPCQPVPLVSFASRCNGELEVTYANGDRTHEAGGTAVFQILGAGGYFYETGYGLRPGEEVIHYVPPYAATSVTVKANNAVVAQSSWATAPGCSGYDIDPANPPAGGGQSGTGGGSGGSGGGLTGGGLSGGPAGADPSPAPASAEPSTTAGPGTPTPSGTSQSPAPAMTQPIARRPVSPVTVGIATGLGIVTVAGALTGLLVVLRRRARVQSELSE